MPYPTYMPTAWSTHGVGDGALECPVHVRPSKVNVISTRIRANRRGRARPYHDQRYRRWCGVLAKKVAHNIFAGGSPDEPWVCPGQSPCHYNAQYTRHPAWCPFAYLGCRLQMASSCCCTCTRNFLQVLPTGLWTLVARAGEASVVPPGVPQSQTTGEGWEGTQTSNSRMRWRNYRTHLLANRMEILSLRMVV